MDAQSLHLDPRQLLRPRRGRLTEARAAIEGISDPSQAWSALLQCGIVPASWNNDPGRRFIAVGDDGLRVGSNDSLRPPESAAPVTIRAALAIACDVEGVLAAEADARTCAAALVVWQAPVANRIVWDVALRTGPSKLFVGGPSELLLAGEAAKAAVLAHESADSPRTEPLHSPAQPRVTDVEVPHVVLGLTPFVEGAAWWQRARALGARFVQSPEVDDAEGTDPCEDEWWVPDPFVGRLVREVEDPFAPFLELCALGYVLAAIERDRLVLVAAEV